MSFHILGEIENATLAAVNGNRAAARPDRNDACGISIAGSNATFRVPEGKVGSQTPVTPPLLYLLYARVDRAKANYLMFTAARIGQQKPRASDMSPKRSPTSNLLIGSEQSSNARPAPRNRPSAGRVLLLMQKNPRTLKTPLQGPGN